MAPKGYLYLLEKLGLSQRGAARFLGIAERTSRNYASGERAIDPRTAMLLELMVRREVSVEEALRTIGIDAEKAAKATVKNLGTSALPRYYD
jgi:hypothetical protein